MSTPIIQWKGRKPLIRHPNNLARSSILNMSGNTDDEKRENMLENKSSLIDVEDSLFISDVEEDDLIVEPPLGEHNNVQENGTYDDKNATEKEQELQYYGSKRRGTVLADYNNGAGGKLQKRNPNSFSIAPFSQGQHEINEECGYLTINAVGSVYHYTNESTLTLKVTFFNNFANTNYEFELTEEGYDCCFLSKFQLVLANSSTGAVLMRDHGVTVNETTSFVLSLLNNDFISSITVNDESQNSSNKIYIATGLGSLFILDKFGNMFKKLLVPSVTQMFLNGDKLLFIHNDSKYSVLLHSFKKSGEKSSYLRYISRELDLPNEMVSSEITNLGISELGTPWISTRENFYKLINSYNASRSYWVNALNYSNEVERLHGGHLTKELEHSKTFDLETIWPVDLKSDLDDSIIGVVTNYDGSISFPLPTLKNFETTSTTVTVKSLKRLHTQQEAKILKGEDKEEDDNFTRCDLNDEQELSIPKYYSHIDTLLQTDIASDIVTSATLESYYITDKKDLLLKLNNSWDVAILRLFDINCQCKDIDVAYNLVLSLKQDKCLSKASEIAKMYKLLELSDKINELLDARSGY